MSRTRTLSKKNPLYISKFAFGTAKNFAYQYPEWKQQYAETIGQSAKGVNYDGMPHGSGTGNPTASIAIRAAALKGNIDVIENLALYAGRDLWQFLLFGVTNEGVTYNYLRHGMCKELGPLTCGKNEYYQMRRLFYYMLSKHIEEASMKS